MKPRRIEFCRTLPRNATGKLLRRDVRRLDAERDARPTSATG
jgi:acyl-coenzyme A synthetase/AMP-(fatty) acid ligase